MGTPMAHNLLRAGHALTVFNRTASSCEPLRAAGARVARSPEDAAREADVLLLCVSDDRAAEAVLLGPEASEAEVRNMGDRHGNLAAASKRRKGQPKP